MLEYLDILQQNSTSFNFVLPTFEELTFCCHIRFSSTKTFEQITHCEEGGSNYLYFLNSVQ